LRKLKYVGLSASAKKFLADTTHNRYIDKGSLDSYTPDGDYSDAYMHTYEFSSPVRTGDHEVSSLYEDVQMVFDTKKTRYIFTCLRSEWSIYSPSMWTLIEVNKMIFWKKVPDLSEEGVK
jgi:hypothetical protein